MPKICEKCKHWVADQCISVFNFPAEIPMINFVGVRTDWLLYADACKPPFNFTGRIVLWQ